MTVDIAVEWSPPSAALAELTVDGFIKGLREKMPKEQVFDAGTSQVHLPWALAEARSIRLGDTLDARFVFAPACEGKMTIILISAWKHGSQGEATADAWQKGMKMEGPSPACEAMKTLRDPRQ